MMTYLLFLVSMATAADIIGMGASFPWDAYDAVFTAYEFESGIAVDYTPSGSGSGKSAMVDASVDFAGADSFLSDSNYEDRPTLQMVPAILGGICVGVNIPYIADLGETLELTASQISMIFRGEISMWNDDRLLSANSNLADVNEPISVIARSDKSGTTSQFTLYLTNADEDWADAIGETSTFPVENTTFIVASGTDRVAASLLLTDNSITYLAYGTLLDFPTEFQASIINPSGNAIVPSATSFEAAAAGAVFDDRFTTVVSNSPDPDAWPITAFSYFIVDKADCRASWDLLLFFQWYYLADSSNALISINGYSPLPQATKDDVLNLMKEELTCGGEAILVMDTSAYENRSSAIVILGMVMFFIIAPATLILAAQDTITQFASAKSTGQKLFCLCWLMSGLSLVAGIIPWLFSPTDTVCQARVTIWICWAFVLGFFAMRSESLKSLAIALKEGRGGGFVLKFNFLIVAAPVIIELILCLVWVFADNLRSETELEDLITNTGSLACKSDNFGIFVGIQFGLILLMSTVIINNLRVILGEKKLSEKTNTGPILVGTANLLFVFLLICVYVARGNIRDADLFVLVSLMNNLGFAPLLLILLKFNISAAAEKKSKSKGRQTQGSKATKTTKATRTTRTSKQSKAESNTGSKAESTAGSKAGSNDAGDVQIEMPVAEKKE